MSLEKYQQKRKFDITSEPKGKVEKHIDIKKLPIFVIHDHYARQHHHDLRLESEGTLKSWAVPKLTPTEPEVKRLAVQVEDHPLEYAGFTGKIPEGQYGAGIVKIFDKGTYRVLNKTKDLWDIEFAGKKIKGNYVLVRFKNEPKNWLFFKK